MVSSLGSENETFLTRLGELDLLERSSKEQTDSVGEDMRVSGVHERELIEPDGEWQLELLDELTDPGRALLMMDSSAALMRVAARSKWLRAC